MAETALEALGRVELASLALLLAPRAVMLMPPIKPVSVHCEPSGINPVRGHPCNACATYETKSPPKWA
jgi:hypothetical protein